MFDAIAPVLNFQSRLGCLGIKIFRWEVFGENAAPRYELRSPYHLKWVRLRYLRYWICVTSVLLFLSVGQKALKDNENPAPPRTEMDLPGGSTWAVNSPTNPRLPPPPNFTECEKAHASDQLQRSARNPEVNLLRARGVNFPPARTRRRTSPSTPNGGADIECGADIERSQKSNDP